MPIASDDRDMVPDPVYGKPKEPKPPTPKPPKHARPTPKGK
jgi:hypothetical protein